ncbi:MAG TPA: hypothetical protein PKK06_09195 [Phycisphaerae bacterium]|nr:hypothetical protein [Phycisphaerae bacterium]HNU45415.1 hypothetical protein [Phycisphaerae bacterium]
MVALPGIAFIGAGGWRLTLNRQGESSPEDLFEIDKYTAEVCVPEESKVMGKSIGEVGQAVEVECVIVGLAR